MKNSLSVILLGSIAGTVITGSFSACNSSKEKARKPNVIIVLTDDQGYGDFSVHGHPVLQTPVLDKLHGQSIRFTDFHVAPMSTPTRGQLMTGRDAMANGATAVCMGKSMIREELPTIANIFKASGYQTAHFGKWHLGDSYPYRPQDRGFDETVHHGAWGITSIADYYSNTYWNDKYLHNNDLKQYEGYCTDVWFDLSIDFINKRDKGKPFFLYLATNSPHGPHLVDDEFSDPYLEKGMPPVTSKYFGQIANIDKNMQKLLNVLNETGLSENTLLLFMTDNGTLPIGFRVYNAGMRGVKTEPYEGGHRVALFLNGLKPVLGEPRDIAELTQVQDILPTLIDLCDLTTPENVRFDGISLAPLLKGETDKLDDRMLVVQYDNPYQPAENRAVLWKKWRLVKHNELYDLSVDPEQKNDVAGQYPGIVRDMQSYYNKWLDKTLPLYNITRYIRVGSERQNPLMLFSSDWQGEYADSKWCLFSGDRTGNWPIIVETSGKYKITLYRWHPAAGVALDANMFDDWNKIEAGAIPVSQARLKTNQFDSTIITSAGQVSAEFFVDIEAGQDKIETFLMDKTGNVLCSAYYTEVEFIK